MGEADPRALFLSLWSVSKELAEWPLVFDL